MRRKEVLNWLTGHIEQVHDVPEELLSRCETEVRRHAHKDAWLHAYGIADDHSRHWARIWGAHASDAYVAREVCRGLAYEFAHNEPVPEDGHESDFVEEDVLGALDPEAQAVVLAYVHDLALGEEHRAWKEIIRFTRKRGRTLAREAHLSSDLSYEGTHLYSETAARVMDMLARDFQQHARAL